jgi:predicted NAD/FAD-binding protein
METLEFAHVLFCTHSDVTLRLLGEHASKQEQGWLGNIRYVLSFLKLFRLSR